MNEAYSSMNPNQQRRHISREFKKRGLSLQPAALSAIQNVLRREHMNGKSKMRQNVTNEVLQVLLDEIKKRMMNGLGGSDAGAGGRGGCARNGSSNSHGRGTDSNAYNISTLASSSSSTSSSTVVTQEMLQTVVADLSRDGNDVLDEAMQLLNAWKMKRLDYNVMNKRWKLMDGSDEQGGGGSGGNGMSNFSSSSRNYNNMNHDSSCGRSVFGRPGDKVNMLLQRYYFIQQRILRQDVFQNKLSINYSSSSTNMLHNEQHKLTPIEGLLGTTDYKTLLGIIVQLDDENHNQYHLEDPTSSIPLDLSHVQYPSTDGFITQYSIVLIEGHMSDDGEMFIVETIGHPMYENRNDAIDNIGLQHSNIFDTIPNLNELEKLQSEELEHGYNGMFVLLSDVHLDDMNVLEKLEVLFQGFDDAAKMSIEDNHDEEMYENENFPLPVFVLMGDFASNYPSSIGNGSAAGGGHASSVGGAGGGGSKSSSYKSFMAGLFDELATVISKFPRIAKEGRFVLIPSMNDVGMGSILPRPPLPRYFLKGLQSKVKHVHLASNPCRLRYFSKEIVLSRFDLLSKLRRNAILPPRAIVNDDNVDGNDGETTMDDLIRHSIKTVLDQGHLCPVPIHTTPIYWQYDHAMRLYPPPDILILSESTTKRYSEKYHDVEVMNPGPFNVNYEFLVIKPCDVTDEGDEIFVDVEFSQVS